MKVVPLKNRKAEPVQTAPQRRAWLHHAALIGSAISARVDGDAPTESPEAPEELSSRQRAFGTLPHSLRHS
jgi:hypothetical protein